MQSAGQWQRQWLHKRSERMSTWRRMDHLTPRRRSENMAAIKGRDTRPEMVVRRTLHALGYRYRLHRADLAGKPDLVLARYHAVIFVHGCFWHQHSASHCRARPPKTNSRYWVPKLRRNVERDKRNMELLRRSDWRVLVIWECETKNVEALKRKLAGFLS